MASENEQEKREMVADIVAEFREMIYKSVDGLIAVKADVIANRIEAAWKREKAEWEAAACAFVSDAVMSGKVAVEHAPVGNAAAMRERNDLKWCWDEIDLIARQMRIYADDVRKATDGCAPDVAENTAVGIREFAGRLEDILDEVGSDALTPVGNAAALRAALVEMVNADTDGDMTLDSLCGRCIDKLHGTCKHDGSCWCEKVIAALSAPARNCDRLSAEQCKKIFKMEMGIYLPQEATDRDRDIARCTAYGVIDALFAPSDAPFEPSTHRKGEGDGR